MTQPVIGAPSPILWVNTCSKGNQAARAESQFKAKGAWIAISIYDDIYSIYFGTLDILEGNTGIPMTDKHLKKYECLVYEKPHNIDFTPYKNIYEDS
jgi:hypothetical protein